MIATAAIDPTLITTIAGQALFWGVAARLTWNWMWK